MKKSIHVLFILVTLFGFAALAPAPVYANFIGAKLASCCPQGSPDRTSLAGPGTVKSGSWGFMSISDGLYGDTNSIVKTPSANDEGLELSLRYASYNANGNNVSLDTGMGFGWSHSYNMFLFTQNLNLFKMSPGGVVTKYQRAGRSGALTAVTGTQQTVTQNPDGSINITNRQGGTSYRFASIPGNPVRVAAMAPMMLTSITDRDGNLTQLSYQNGLLAQVTDTYGRHIKFTYDATNHLTTITDPLNRVTQLNYGGYGNLTKITDPLGNTVQYSYDVRHQIVGKSDKNGKQWAFSYDATGNPTSVADQAGNRILSLTNAGDWATNSTDLAISQLRTYIPSVTTLTDGRGNQWQYTYNANGQITKVVTPDNATTSYTYDPVTLNLAIMTDANSHATQYQYDAFGNMLQQTDAIGNQIRNVYSNPFNFITQTSYFAAGASTPHSVTSYSYDAYGNRIQEIHDVGGMNLKSVWTYDNQGHVSSWTDPNAHVSSYTYDAYGNQNQVTDAQGNVTHYTYDTVGNKTRTVDANNNIWLYGPYDALNRLLAESDPLGYATQYIYDGMGDRIQISKQVTLNPSRFETTQYQYDLRNRLSSEIRDPGGLNLVNTFGYDYNDNRISLTDPRGMLTQYNYDVQNRLNKVTDALANITQTQYDPVGNISCAIDANQHYIYYDYDALNRVSKQSRKIGVQQCTTGSGNDIVTQTFYDSGATMPCAANPGSPGCSGPTPGSSNIAYRIDPNGNYTYFKYDNVDRRWITIRKVADSSDSCDGNDWCRRTLYDSANNVIASIDANGNQSNYTYFNNNWRRSEANALNEITAYTYDGVGNIQTLLSPGNNLTTRSYDARNELIQVSDTIGRVASNAYDGIGNRTQNCDGNNNCSVYGYDAVNRLIAVTDPMGSTSNYSYDPNGNLLVSEDRLNKLTCFQYDAINRRTLSMQLGGGGSSCPAAPGPSDVWTYSRYDAVGNVLAYTTAKQGSTPALCNSANPPADCETTGYAYDAVNRLIQETYADAGVRSFAYDNVGNPVQRIDQQGRSTNYVYNDLYYLTARNYQVDTSDSFTYDIGGRMLTAERGGWQDTFSYDAANRVLQASQNGQTVNYAYDTANRCRTLTYPSTKVAAECRTFREMLDEINNGNLVAYTYDLGNRVQNRSYGNGATTNYVYDNNNWITSLNHTHGATLFAGFDYSYDKEGNKQYEQNQPNGGISQAYQYDDLYRLIHYSVGTLNQAGTVPVPLTQTQYDLDTLGNWNDMIKNGVTQTRRHNTVNEITQINNSTLSYDGNGNLIQDPVTGYFYVYDQENRLTTVTFVDSGGLETAVQYSYDALSRRIDKKAGSTRGNQETHYFYDDSRIIEEQDTTGATTTTTTYTYGNNVDEVLSMDRNSQTYFYHQNALGSVEAVTDSSGNVVERYAYDAYGQPTITNSAGTVLTNAWGTAHSAIGNPWQFTGRQLDEETGLYFYRARYYDSAKGRFLERDPLAYVNGGNLYEYVQSSPTKFADPDGKALVVILVVGAVLIGGLAIWSYSNSTSTVPPAPPPPAVITPTAVERPVTRQDIDAAAMANKKLVKTSLARLQALDPSIRGAGLVSGDDLYAVEGTREYELAVLDNLVARAVSQAIPRLGGRISQGFIGNIVNPDCDNITTAVLEELREIAERERWPIFQHYDIVKITHSPNGWGQHFYIGLRRKDTQEVVAFAVPCAISTVCATHAIDQDTYSRDAVDPLSIGLIQWRLMNPDAR